VTLRLCLLAAALGVSALAQTTVRLRDRGTGFYVTGASNTTPIVIQTGAPHGFTSADVGLTIDLWNVPFDNGSGKGWMRLSKLITCGNAGENVLYGNFRIASVTDATHFAIADLAGNPVPARGVWCDGGGGVDNGGAQWGGRTTAYTLTPGMRGWYDGDDGSYTRRLALGTHNGLVSLVVNGNVATAVTSFQNYLSEGAQVAIWGSGNAALDKSHAGHTVSVDSPTQFRFTTSGVADGVYTGRNMTCGSSGNKDCLRVSALAIAGNPFWDAVDYSFRLYSGQRAVIDGGSVAFTPFNGGGSTYANAIGAAGLMLLVDQGNSQALADVLYAIRNVEHFLSTAWVIDDAQNNGGYANWSDTISYLFYGMANLYAVGRPFLTAGERQTFVDKMFNDITDPGGCTRSLPIRKTGATIAFDGINRITGTGTLWMTDPDPNQRVGVGDVIFRPSLYLASRQYYVIAVDSDTSLTVRVTPSEVSTWSNQQFVLYHKWAPGACGALWFKKHWQGSASHSGMYPLTGGNLGTWHNSPTRYRPAAAGNNGYTWAKGLLALSAAAADDDPRAALRFEEAQSHFFDWMLPTSLGYTTGFQHSGSYYSWGRTVPDASQAATTLANSVAGFPDLGLSSFWITRPPLLKLYGILPDKFAGWFWPVRWGSETGDNRIRANSCEYTLDSVGRLAPRSPAAQLFKSWRLASVGIYSGCAAEEFIGMGDPTIGTLDYRTLPTQHLFRSTSLATCEALGMNCPPKTRGDGVVSRTGWNDPNDTHVTFMARSFIGDHDVHQPGALHIYKRGALVQDGKPTPGGFGANDDTTALENVLVFGEANTFYFGQGRSDGRDGIAFIDRWSGSDPLGDEQSRYVYSQADVAGTYKTPIDRAKVQMLHFKKPGGEEIVMQYYDVDVSGKPTSIRGQIHYPQNGQAGNDFKPAEGATTCPGPAGCAGLNTDRTILSQQSGNAPYTNGVMTKIVSPSPITVRYDGSTYAGSESSSVRVSICGGTSCGATVAGAEWLAVHKVSSSPADRELDVTPLNPDLKWTGVQTTGTVALFSRNGGLPITANFRTTHAGVAQYLIAGLEGGHPYRVYRVEDSTEVAAADVPDGDNTLYFEAAAGTYLIFPAGLSNLFLGPRAPIRVRRQLQYDFRAAGGDTEYVWSVSAGTLPAGLTLAPNGILSGTPTQTGSFELTIRAQETGAPFGAAEATISLTVEESPLTISVTGAAGGGHISYGSAGLDALQSCGITVSALANFSSVVESLTDQGGAAWRQVVLGSAGPLLAGTPYYVRITCGNSTGEAQFVTPADGIPAPTQIAVAASPRMSTPVASMQVQYGPTPQLGNSVTAPCPAECVVAVPAMSETVIYLKRVYLDAASQVVAESGVTPLVARRSP
jgi:hypothetical protein